MGNREARGLLEESPLIRVTVDARIGASRLRLLAAPYEGGEGPVDPHAAGQWGEEHEITLDVTARRTAGNGRQPLLERLRHELAARWPAPEGCMFLAASQTHDLSGPSGSAMPA